MRLREAACSVASTDMSCCGIHMGKQLPRPLSVKMTQSNTGQRTCELERVQLQVACRYTDHD